MQPASQFEKVILIWLASGLGFIVVYLCIFYLFDAVGVAYVNNRDWSPDKLAMIRRIGMSLKIDSFFADKTISEIPPLMWVFTALLHPFTMAFSLLIRRYGLPLVVVIVFALLIFSHVGNNVLLHWLTGSEVIGSSTPFRTPVPCRLSNAINIVRSKCPSPLVIRFVIR